MKNVFICSPYGGKDENIKLAKRFMRYAAWCGLTPLAPHVMFHQVLDDFVPAQREQGMAAGREMLKLCRTIWCCGDEMTPGMKQELQYAEANFYRIRRVPIAELADWETDIMESIKRKIDQITTDEV